MIKNWFPSAPPPASAIIPSKPSQHQSRSKAVLTLIPPDYNDQLRRASRRPSYKFTGSGPIDYESSETWFPPYRRWAYSIGDLPSLKLPSDSIEAPKIARSRGRAFKEGAKSMGWEEYRKKNGKRADRNCYDRYCQRFFKEVHGVELLPVDQSPSAFMQSSSQVSH